MFTVAFVLIISSGILAMIDPFWSAPLQTLLLFALTYLVNRVSRKVDTATNQVEANGAELERNTALTKALTATVNQEKE